MLQIKTLHLWNVFEISLTWRDCLYAIEKHRLHLRVNGAKAAVIGQSVKMSLITHLREKLCDVLSVVQLVRRLLLQEGKPGGKRAALQWSDHLPSRNRSCDFGRVSYLQIMRASHRTGTYSGWSAAFWAHMLSIFAMPVSSFKSFRQLKKLNIFGSVCSCRAKSQRGRGADGPTS